MKKYLLVMFLFFSSCEIEEVLRQPLLASPLGLQVKTAPALDSVGGGTGIVLFFYANNPEIYFSGFSIYISTRAEDFESIGENAYWPINPMSVENSEARLLTNYTKISDTNMSIYVGGEMSYPERRTYPESVGWDSSTSSSSSPEFTWTTFNSFPPKYADDGETITLPGDVFRDNTTYYFAVYSYSSIDNEWSLPSNVESITWE